MDTYSSREDVIIKTRKPYTITKQRERWTEEEHNRFLEALKLYGRAWQRIEEHIGTKSAVQIRSHAQKFFSKLEKEALDKGIPIGQALDIDIPPPRPKRKPSNPYPRKTSMGVPTSQVRRTDVKSITSNTRLAEQILDLEKESLPAETPSISITSVEKNSRQTPVAIRNSCMYREFMPSMKDARNQDQNNESLVSDERKENQKLHECDAKQTVQDNGTNAASNSGDCHTTRGKMISGDMADKVCYPENCGQLPTNDLQTSQNYLRDVPVHVLDRTPEVCSQMPTLDMPYQESISRHMGGINGQPSFTNLSASANTENQDNMSRSSIHQSLPTFPFTFDPVQNNQEDFHISAFSSLIVSTLLQNPAAHAAASFAASFWPCTNLGTSGDSPAGGFPPREMSAPPNMSAIVAATVAAATAWWTAHGLLPLCAPLHPGFSCTPAPTTINPSTCTGQALTANKEIMEITPQSAALQAQKLDPEYYEALQARNSSDSEESGFAKLNTVITAPGHEKKDAVSTELLDSNKAKSGKQVDRSSCGSNTPSSSEGETDALEKNENGKGEDELEEPDANHLVSESINRCSRSTSNINDFWKEVSEEGRLAFRALFSREVLPQSFLPPHGLKNKGLQRINIEEGKMSTGASQLDLKRKTWEKCPHHQEMEKNVRLRGNSNGEEGMLSMGLAQGRLLARRTGFKPYKRCSFEAKENRVATGNCQNEENRPKRIRLGGEALI